ncbi:MULTISPECIES: M50 family metallopeptidase [unclassified Thermosipho (in: thermotogales)]|uniref:M50 family metallopeptidase n=1 Tax=unclassified Thermosipho (in: thermotogales) TaxID=2676525 RepID=UPI00155FE1E8|nr:MULTISPECIES: site-2 protease family protein [unclassified Thermosipho (in: thermotogales)]
MEKIKYAEVISILTFVSFVLVFMFVVVVHEFGHFLFAKIFKVGVLEFSIGFGPALFKKKFKETLFRINIIPFGGYVRLKGEDFDEEVEDGLYAKPAWQRLLIAFAGPLFSILAAYILFIPIVTNWGVPAVTVGKVIDNSPAAEYGLKDGDVILKVNGKRVFDSIEVSEQISKGKVVEFQVLRDDKVITISIPPRITPPEYIFVLDDVYGDIKGSLKKINGFTPGVNLQLKNGEFIELEDNFGNTLSGVVVSYSFVGERPTIGFYYAGFESVISKDISPFRTGDRIVKVNSMEIRDYVSLLNLVSRLGLKQNQMYIDIWGNKIKTKLLPLDDNLEIVVIRDGIEKKLNMKREDFSKLITTPGFFKQEQKYLKPKNLFDAVSLAIQRCNSAAKTIWKAFGKLFLGKGVNQVAGPVGIAVIVGEAAKAGWETILTVVALFTLNLGIFNLLPLPALDGGRIVFSLIEIITRKKVNRKIEAIVHTIGFFVLMALAFYFMFADFTRFF